MKPLRIIPEFEAHYRELFGSAAVVSSVVGYALDVIAFGNVINLLLTGILMVQTGRLYQ